MMDERRAWFAPKRYGYGTALPVTWQGWLVLLGYVVLMTATAVWAVRSHVVVAILVQLAATAALVEICRRRTRGGWRWRWGEDG